MWMRMIKDTLSAISRTRHQQSISMSALCPCLQKRSTKKCKTNIAERCEYFVQGTKCEPKGDLNCNSVGCLVLHTQKNDDCFHVGDRVPMAQPWSNTRPSCIRLFFTERIVYRYDICQGTRSTRPSFCVSNHIWSSLPTSSFTGRGGDGGHQCKRRPWPRPRQCRGYRRWSTTEQCTRIRRRSPWRCPNRQSRSTRHSHQRRCQG